MKYKLTEETIKHLSYHFLSNKIAGSKFRNDIFPDPQRLCDYIEEREPNWKKEQSNNTEVHGYEIPELDYIGWQGIGLKAAYPNFPVRSEIRNGFECEYLLVETLPKTNFFHIICKPDFSAPPEIITMFPGIFAPAFPHNRMNREEQEKAIAFWEINILLRIP